MSLDTQCSNATVSAGADAMLATLNNGYIRFYTTAKPANANTALGAQVLLAELRFGATAFAPSVNGLGTANAIVSGSGLVTGVAVWARLVRSDGTTVAWDITVGTGGTNIILAPSATITAGQAVSVTLLTLQVPIATAGL